MIFDDDVFDYDTCWDCVFWYDGYGCCGPHVGHCTGEPDTVLPDGSFIPLVVT